MLNSLIIISITSLAAISTYILQQKGLSAVLASCLVGLSGVLLHKITHFQDLDTAIFTGSFVGMTSALVLNQIDISIAGLISGILFVLLKNKFVGMGGKFGSIAFISVVLVFFCLYLYKSNHK